MPEGIVATVEDGYATLDFVDPTLRGAALTKLLDIGGPGTIETLTRVGPRRQYRVPEGNAREAGLLDDATEEHPARGSTAFADSDPENDALTSEGGVRGAFTPGSAGTDTGAAAALKAANPNVNAGADGADWHTPTAEYTSANAYVGETTAAEERAMAPSPFTGLDAPVGGKNAAETQTHREVIDQVTEYKHANPKGHARGAEAQTAVRQAPAQHLNTALKDQAGALASDPGGWAEQPDADHPSVGLAPAAEGSEDIQTQASAGTAEGITAPDVEDVVEYPQGEPTSDWRRDELDAYALKVKGLDTSSKSDFPAKKDVLAAINSAK
ncbi:hypothetical protein PBI_INDLOVU_14 [Mycobacterium phage Indlovu]|nr:hypothetical protein PBI_INDLOVU_14 [Mycobacterium phage Indlovu]